MKMKYFALSLLAVAGITLTSCSDDSYDIKGDPNNYVFIYEHAQRYYDAYVYHTPVGDYGDVKASFPAKIQRPQGGDVIVSAEADTTLVAQYNATGNNGTVAKSVPASVLRSLVVTPDTIPAGEYETKNNVTVEVPNNVLGELTEPLYVLPLRVKANGFTSSQDLGTAYLIIETTNDYAEFYGSTTKNCAIVRTPVGVFGEISTSFTARVRTELSVPVTFTLKPDQSLVDAYNSEHGTDYQPLPDNIVNALQIGSTQVDANQVQGNEPITVSVDKSLAQSLTGKGYVLPLRLVSSANGQSTETDKVCYLIVTTEESLINDNATEILGTIVEDHDDWSCVSADIFNPDDFQEAFNTDWGGGWAPTQSRVSSGQVVVDFGDTHKVSSVMVHMEYVLNSAKFEVSTDNRNWTEIGSTSGHKTVRDDDYNEWLVLYGGVSARYMRITLNLDKDSWAWQYMRWGYGSLNFNCAFDD